MKLFIERIFISVGNKIGVRRHKKNLKDYKLALQAFEQASEYEKTASAAKQWLKYAKAQYRQKEQLASLIDL